MKRKILKIFAISSLLLVNTSYSNTNITYKINDINNSVISNEQNKIEKPVEDLSGVEYKVEDLSAADEQASVQVDSIQDRKDVFEDVKNAQYVVRLESQSKQELKTLYDRGFRVFEITVSATTDGNVVLADDFNEYFQKYYGKTILRPTIDEYFSHTMLDESHQMSIGDINVFLNDYPDARFFVRSLDKGYDVFEILNNKSLKNKDKLIFEIQNVIANYKSFENLAVLDMKNDLSIYSFAANNRDKNIVFLYQNVMPTDKEIEEIKKFGQKIYDTHITIMAKSKNYNGHVYAIEDAVNLPINIPEPVRSNTYVSPIIQNDRFIAHAGGRIMGIVGTNTLQAMNSSYARGNRLIEIDFDWTLDGIIVQVHDWATFRKLSGDTQGNSYYMTLEEYKSQKMINGLKQMSIEDTIAWLRQNKDAYIITDVKENNMTDGNVMALKEFAKQGPDIQSRLIPQIYDTVQYQKVKELGYENIIYTLYRTEQSDYGVLEFAKSNDLFAVTMDNLYRVYTNLPKLLTNNGIRVYIHTENDKDKARAYILNQKAHGIYSDDILSIIELENR